MSRSARQASESGDYHVIMRGNNKRWIFKGDRNKERFLGMLEEQIGEGLVQVAAWCVMDNHVHLVLKAEKEKLTKAIKRINIKYAMGYNKRMESSGHVFQDRFKSQRIGISLSSKCK